VPSFKVAHIREQGNDMIIFPLTPEFGQLAGAEQDQELAFLGSRANSAGLRGVAVAVWDLGHGRVAFRGPVSCYPFLSAINMRYVMANVNREISW